MGLRQQWIAAGVHRICVVCEPADSGFAHEFQLWVSGGGANRNPVVEGLLTVTEVRRWGAFGNRATGFRVGLQRL